MSGVGHLGELEVIDFLRRERKHEIYLPLKDQGIDFISSIDDRFYQIQVKTSMFQKNSYFWFDLHEEKLRFSKNTLYIFVCKSLGRRNFMGKHNNFLVIPSMKIKEWILKNRLARKKRNRNIFNIFVYPDLKNKKWIYRNKQERIDITRYWNNFGYFD